MLYQITSFLLDVVVGLLGGACLLRLGQELAEHREERRFGAGRRGLQIQTVTDERVDEPGVAPCDVLGRRAAGHADEHTVERAFHRAATDEGAA